MKHLALFFLCGYLMLFLPGCFIPTQSSGLEKGSIRIKLNTDSRSVLNPKAEDIKFDYYQIIGDGPGSHYFEEGPYTDDNASEITIDNLNSGYWIVRVDAYNQENQILASGSKATVILENKTSNINVALQLLQKTEGIFNLSYLFPDSVGIDEVEVELSRAGDDPFDQKYLSHLNITDLAGPDSQVRFQQSDLPAGRIDAGDYRLILRFKKAGALLYSRLDIINCYNNIPTLHEINLNTDDFFSAPAAPLAPLTITANSEKVNISWDASAVLTENGFRIERSSAVDFSASEVFLLDKNKNSYEDKTALPGTDYYYRIASYNKAGISNWLTASSPFPVPLRAPSYSLPDGSYSQDIEISLTAEGNAVDIYYSWGEASDPETSGILYSGPLSIAGNGTSQTLKALVKKSGFDNSSIITKNYSIDYSKVSRPVFEPQGGSYQQDLSVNISCLTDSAQIYYTTDGSAPSAASTPYSSPVSIAGDKTNITIRAICLKSGMSDSDPAASNYQINYPEVPAPIFSYPPGNYSTDINLSLSSFFPEANIYYTLDGSDPAGPQGILYEVPIQLKGNTLGTEEVFLVRAAAILEGSGQGSSSAEYRIRYNPLSSPLFTLDNGNSYINGHQVYNGNQKLKIECLSSDCEIYYTMTNSADSPPDPDRQSIFYSPGEEISISGHGTIKTFRAFAIKEGRRDSEITEVTIEIKYQVEAVTFNPPAGSYYENKNLELSTYTSSASIYYTTDGSAPDPSLYGDSTFRFPETPITLVGPDQITSIRAIAVKDSYQTSIESSASYRIDTQAPDEVTEENALAGVSQIQLSWTNPLNSDFSHLLIQYDGGSGYSSPIAVSKTKTSYTLEGLNANTSYDIRIQTVDEGGNSSTGKTISNVETLSAAIVIQLNEPDDIDIDFGNFSSNPVLNLQQSIDVTVYSSLSVSSYTWLINGVVDSGDTDNTYTLNGSDYSAGEKPLLSVEIELTDGHVYSANIRFEVVN